MREGARILWCLAGTMITGLLAGCSPVQQQGWIGGDFKQAGHHRLGHTDGHTVRALPAEVAETQKGAVFVSRVFENTPLFNSQIQPGDLIVSVNGKPINSLKTFRNEIKTTEPGETLQARVYRDGMLKDRAIVVGRELFGEKRRLLGVGLYLDPRIDLIPDADFEVFGLLGYRLWDYSIDMASPEYTYAKQAKHAQGAASSTGWSWHLGPVWASCRRYAKEQRCFSAEEVQ